MIRRAFTMKLKPNALAEYKRHHDNVWPELVREIERSGIASITTFQSGLDLFLISEIRNPQAWDKLWTSDIHRKWAEVMEPLMHLTDDGIVDAGELIEIFHLETKSGQAPASSRRTSKKKGTLRRGIAAKSKAARSKLSANGAKPGTPGKKKKKQSGPKKAKAGRK